MQYLLESIDRLDSLLDCAAVCFVRIFIFETNLPRNFLVRSFSASLKIYIVFLVLSVIPFLSCFFA